MCDDGKLGGGQCVCPEGYFGDKCEHTCPTAGGQTCNGKGECQDGRTGSGECKCDDEFTGPDCTIPCDCSGQGTCTYSVDTTTGDIVAECVCNTGFLGEKCDKTPCTDCSPTPSCHHYPFNGNLLATTSSPPLQTATAVSYVRGDLDFSTETGVTGRAVVLAPAQQLTSTNAEFLTKDFTASTWVRVDDTTTLGAEMPLVCQGTEAGKHFKLSLVELTPATTQVCSPIPCTHTQHTQQSASECILKPCTTDSTLSQLTTQHVLELDSVVEANGETLFTYNVRPCVSDATGCQSVTDITIEIQATTTDMSECAINAEIGTTGDAGFVQTNNCNTGVHGASISKSVNPGDVTTQVQLALTGTWEAVCILVISTTSASVRRCTVRRLHCQLLLFDVLTPTPLPTTHPPTVRLPQVLDAGS